MQEVQVELEFLEVVDLEELVFAFSVADHCQEESTDEGLLEELVG